jgi:hypothetical protein
MTRIWLIAILSVTLAEPALAQDNPNSPRGRRELRVNPPPPAALPGQVGETIEAERWGTLSRPVPQRPWGTMGGTGWPGVASPPQGQPR